MTHAAIATAADYADGMITARRAKNGLFLALLLLLVADLALFFLARYRVDPAVALTSTRASAASAVDLLKYGIGLIEFLGVALPIVLAADLLLIINIMLVGRLIGLADLVRAFLWCMVLAALLFPWQAFLINQDFTSVDFKIPGVLFSWDELAARARYHPAGALPAILFWTRFVAAPAAALLILLSVQSRSSRGLRLALGEESPVLPGDISRDR